MSLPHGPFAPICIKIGLFILKIFLYKFGNEEQMDDEWTGKNIMLPVDLVWCRIKTHKQSTDWLNILMANMFSACVITANKILFHQH